MVAIVGQLIYTAWRIVIEAPLRLSDSVTRAAAAQRRKKALEFVTSVRWAEGTDVAKLLRHVAHAEKVELRDWFYENRSVWLYVNALDGLVMLHQGSDGNYTATVVPHHIQDLAVA